MVFDDGGEISREGLSSAAAYADSLSSTTPSSTTPPSSDALSLAERYAVVREQLDAIAAVAPRDLDGAGALGLFDAAYEFGDRFTAIATRALPVVETDVVWATEARTFPNWIARRT